MRSIEPTKGRRRRDTNTSPWKEREREIEFHSFLNERLGFSNLCLKFKNLCVSVRVYEKMPSDRGNGEFLMKEGRSFGYSMLHCESVPENGMAEWRLQKLRSRSSTIY